MVGLASSPVGCNSTSIASLEATPKSFSLKSALWGWPACCRKLPYLCWTGGPLPFLTGYKLHRKSHYHKNWNPHASTSHVARSWYASCLFLYSLFNPKLREDSLEFPAPYSLLWSCLCPSFQCFLCLHERAIVDSNPCSWQIVAFSGNVPHFGSFSEFPVRQAERSLSAF